MVATNDSSWRFLAALRLLITFPVYGNIPPLPERPRPARPCNQLSPPRLGTRRPPPLCCALLSANYCVTLEDDVLEAAVRLIRG